jgi:hypothetical protein
MLFWIAVLAFVVAAAWVLLYVRRKAQERARAEEARAAAFMMDFAGAQKGAAKTADAVAASPLPATPVPIPPPPSGDIALQKLLFEAARKAGDAGEPELAIQLYARLLSRFPATGFADAARVAVKELKTRVAKR